MESGVLFPSGVKLGQAAFAGFPEAVVQVYTGFLHGPAYHIVTDITGTGEEIAEVAGVHSPDSGDGVAFDAGNLHKTADGITGKT